MINVAFVHVGPDTLLPRILVRSVRRVMPDAGVFQLTDEHTDALEGVDRVLRRPYDGVHLMTFRMAHLANLDPCDAVFLDTDCIVERSLEAVFERDFDVALTRRENIGVDPLGTDVAAVMPYNTGVMFSRPSGWDFWVNASRYCESLPDRERRWWGDQLAVKAIAEIAPLRILDLPCELYNYSPSAENEIVAERFVVHYKGQRKSWMIRRGRMEMGLAD